MPSLQTSPLPPSSPSFILLSMMSYGMEYPWGQPGSAVLAVSPPSVFCSPRPVGQAGMSLIPEHTDGFSCYYQHYFHPKSEPQHYTSYQEEN